MENLRGRMLGHYEVRERVGTGGAASVYRAYDTRMKRDVALKILDAATNEEPGQRERFRAEIELLATLDHPNILPVYDIGEVDGQDFLVMKFMKNGTLQDRLSQCGSLPLELACRITADIAAALDRAHECRVVHRDVKPANILLDDRDRALLADFGIAKPEVGGHGHTLAGFAIGTPAYMSPEQCEARPLTGKSDLYSLGVVLWELVLGRVPFDGETGSSVMLKHMNICPTIPEEARARISPGLARVLERSLAKNPEDRFENGAVMAAALAAAVTSDASLVTADRPRVISDEITAPLGDSIAAPRSEAPTRSVTGRRRREIGVVAAAASVLVLGIGYRFQDRLFGSEPRRLEPAPISAPTPVSREKSDPSPAPLWPPTERMSVVLINAVAHPKLADAFEAQIDPKVRSTLRSRFEVKPKDAVEREADGFRKLLSLETVEPRALRGYCNRFDADFVVVVEARDIKSQTSVGGLESGGRATLRCTLSTSIFPRDTQEQFGLEALGLESDSLRGDETPRSAMTKGAGEFVRRLDEALAAERERVAQEGRTHRFALLSRNADNLLVTDFQAILEAMPGLVEGSLRPISGDSAFDEREIEFGGFADLDLLKRESRFVFQARVKALEPVILAHVLPRLNDLMKQGKADDATIATNMWGNSFLFSTMQSR